MILIYIALLFFLIGFAGRMKSDFHYRMEISSTAWLVAGVLVTLSVEWLELHLKIDDPGGSISVHAVGGLWGLVAASFLGHFPGGTGEGQWMAQFTGAGTLLGFMFPMIYGLNWVLNRMMRFRVTLDGERQGVDLHELGANAYPELVSHLEDFQQR